MSIILWIDPGTTTIGFALLEKDWNSKVNILDYGIIHTEPKIDQAMKLLEIGQDIENIIDKYSPEIAVVEKLFFTKNLKTGIAVAEARWVIVYILAKKWIKILEYTPLEMKNSICWYGSANKKQVQNAIKMIMRLDEIPKPDDAADAIGFAYMWVLNYKSLFL